MWSREGLRLKGSRGSNLYFLLVYDFLFEGDLQFFIGNERPSKRSKPGEALEERSSDRKGRGQGPIEGRATTLVP